MMSLPGPSPEVPPFENAPELEDAAVPPIGDFLAVDEAMDEFARTQLQPVADPVARLQRLLQR